MTMEYVLNLLYISEWILLTQTKATR